MSRRLLSFTAAGSSKEKIPKSRRLLETASSEGDEVMSGTHYTDEPEEEEVDPLSVKDPSKELGRRRRVSFSTNPKGKEVQRRQRSPSPPEFNEEDFREMMEEILEGIRRREEWTGQAAEEIGMRLEDLSEEQQRTWHAMTTNREESEKTGAIAQSHIKRWHEDLA